MSRKKSQTQSEDRLEELTDKAITRLEEVVKFGTITFDDDPEKGPGEPQKLDVKDVIDVCKALTSIKIKKPHFVEAPEDFTPPDTTS